MTKIAYVTNNIAPFRVALLDTLAVKADVTLYYVRALEKGVNETYVSKRPERAKLVSIPQLGIKKTLDQLAKADAVIFDGYAGRYKWQLLLGCLMRKIPYSISVDGLIHHDSFGLKKWLKQLALRPAHLVFSNDHRTDSILHSLVPNIRVRRHMFTTMSKEAVQEGFNKRRGNIQNPSFQEEAPIVFVGKFLTEKGVDEFVDATQSLYRKKIMIGGTVEELNHLGIAVDELFTVIPYASQEEVYQFMQKAVVFVLPTYSDTWGLVVVEALSNGVPVVTTTMCNAGVELIQEGKTGFIVPKGNVSDLQMRIQQAMELSPSEVVDTLENQMSDYTLEAAAKHMLQTLTKEAPL